MLFSRADESLRLAEPWAARVVGVRVDDLPLPDCDAVLVRPDGPYARAILDGTLPVGRYASFLRAATSATGPGIAAALPQWFGAAG